MEIFAIETLLCKKGSDFAPEFEKKWRQNSKNGQIWKAKRRHSFCLRPPPPPPLSSDIVFGADPLPPLLRRHSLWTAPKEFIVEKSEARKIKG